MSILSGLSQTHRIALTVAAVLAFMLFIVGSFVYRITLPRAMSVAELRANDAFLFEVPRSFDEFTLTDHRGQPFTKAQLEGQWTLIFFGFTYCPDICPTTMAFLNTLVKELQGTEVGSDTRVVMVSVDPARDTVEQLAGYVPFFNADFLGVTGEFLDIHRFATALNTPFRKVPGEDGDYLIDHGGNIALINPMGDFHAFFKPPFELAKMKVTYRAIRHQWRF